MKYISGILIGALLLTACQQEEPSSEQSDKPATVAQPEKTNPATKPDAEAATPEADAEAATPEAATHSHDEEAAHAHDHAEAKPKEPFLEVEPQAECDVPEVIEFFAYHCPHCYSLEPAAAAWRAKNEGKVKFRSVPSDLGHQQFGSYLLVHHAAKALGVLEKTQHALFERFHKEKKLFASPEEATEFLVAQGADAEKAAELLADPKLMTKSIEADYKLLHAYKVASVPQLLVNHSYITDISRAGGQEEAFAMVDTLLAKESKCVKK